jgi:DNA ligase-associated metallophosphoesterase
MGEPVILTRQGEPLHLLPQRGVYRPSNDTLYITDTHWGKDATFRAHRIPLPEGTLHSDLTRLSNALHQTHAKRLVILGDLIHTEHSYTDSTIESVSHWRGSHPNLTIELITGNHDRGNPPPEWKIIPLGANAADNGFFLSHQPQDISYNLCGHLHPAWTVRGKGRQEVRLPCFLETSTSLILPAFSEFTGTIHQLPDAIHHVYAVTSASVFQVK